MGYHLTKDLGLKKVLQGLLRTKHVRKRPENWGLFFFSGSKQGGRRWRGTRPFLGSSDLSSEDRDKGRREECTDGSLFCLSQRSCTAEVKGNCFKIPFAKSAVCFSAIPPPWDANCKPVGLVFYTHLFWSVYALSRGPGTVDALQSITPIREWGKSTVGSALQQLVRRREQKDALERLMGSNVWLGELPQSCEMWHYWHIPYLRWHLTRSIVFLNHFIYFCNKSFISVEK